MVLPVWPCLNFWYYLGIISSPSWFFSSLAIGFVKKSTGLFSVFLILILLFSWFILNIMLSKFYFSQNKEADSFFRGYERAGKTVGYTLLFFGNIGLYYYSEKSIACMLTFLFLAFYCLCALFCIQPYTDFGVLEFLLSASINVGLTLVGLHSYYLWLVIIACIVMAGVRYRLEPVCPLQVEVTRDLEAQTESDQPTGTHTRTELQSVQPTGTKMKTEKKDDNSHLMLFLDMLSAFDEPTSRTGSQNFHRNISPVRDGGMKKFT